MFYKQLLYSIHAELGSIYWNLSFIIFQPCKYGLKSLKRFFVVDFLILFTQEHHEDVSGSESQSLKNIIIKTKA